MEYATREQNRNAARRDGGGERRISEHAGVAVTRGPCCSLASTRGYAPSTPHDCYVLRQVGPKCSTSTYMYCHPRPSTCGLGCFRFRERSGEARNGCGRLPSPWRSVRRARSERELLGRVEPDDTYQPRAWTRVRDKRDGNAKAAKTRWNKRWFNIKLRSLCPYVHSVALKLGDRNTAHGCFSLQHMLKSLRL